MTSSIERIGWGIAFLALAALGVPWFLWGSDRVVAGLPVWLWWHVGWMLLAAGAFWLFARTSWGLWIEDGGAGSDAATGPGVETEADAARARPTDERGGDRP